MSVAVRVNRLERISRRSEKTLNSSLLSGILGGKR